MGINFYHSFFNKDILILSVSLLTAVLMNRNTEMTGMILPSEREEDLQKIRKRNESGLMKRLLD